MTKIPIYLEPANPLPDNLDAWAEQVAEQIEAALTAMEAEDAPIGAEGEPPNSLHPSKVGRRESS